MLFWKKQSLIVIIQQKQFECYWHTLKKIFIITCISAGAARTENTKVPTTASNKYFIVGYLIKVYFKPIDFQYSFEKKFKNLYKYVDIPHIGEFCKLANFRFSLGIWHCFINSWVYRGVY